MTKRFSKAFLKKDYSTRIDNWQQRANSLGLISDVFLDIDIKTILEYWNYKCVYCERDITDDFEIDHAIPLNKKYSDEYLHLNTIRNLVCSCKHCNASKGNKHYEDFAEQPTIDSIDYYFSML